MTEQPLQYNLPRMPAKGQRRILEAQWLDELESGNLPAEAIKPQGEAPAQLQEAMRLFNGRLYWECHEVLEEVWLETLYPQRFFWSALIKLAVGRHHAVRHNLHGSRVKVGDAVRLLHLFQPDCLGIDTDSVLAYAIRLQRALNSSPSDWSAIDELPDLHIAVSPLKPGIHD